MFTPYDWQEGIANRAQYIESKLEQGAPILAKSLDEGILVFTYRRQSRKIYEIYDRLIYAGVGQQSDVESMRASALEFASREGYNRSEEDVTIQRVANAMSAAVKRAFSDFGTSPLVARSLFAEVNESVADDLYYVIDYDGDYSLSRRSALVSSGTAGDSTTRLSEIPSSMAASDALSALDEIWRSMRDEPHDDNLMPEAVLLERSDARENRFRLMYPEEF
jgi:proteasome alpha subunit